MFISALPSMLAPSSCPIFPATELLGSLCHIGAMIYCSVNTTSFLLIVKKYTMLLSPICHLCSFPLTSSLEAWWQSRQVALRNQFKLLGLEVWKRVQNYTVMNIKTNPPLLRKAPQESFYQGHKQLLESLCSMEEFWDQTLSQGCYIAMKHFIL